VYHRTLDTYQTEDIVSTVYMKAIKNINSLRAKSESEIFAWFLRIAYTTFIDSLRTDKSHESLDDHEHAHGYSTNFQADIDNRTKLEEVMNFMETLSERERTILMLRIWEGRSYQEISTITGESVANAKQIVSRSLAKISANVSYMFIFSLLLHYVY
jgi:RNA polymerase sigma-70 factor (ECF subfamily)